MHRRLLVTFAVLAGLTQASTAHADVGRFMPAAAIDGGEIQRLGDLDLARDGSGALIYVKRIGGIDRIVVSRLQGGAWQAPEILDGALATPGSQPVVAAGDNGQLAIAFISGGALYSVVKPAADQPYVGPTLVTGAASDPSVDLSVNGVGYISFTTPGFGGADVVVARKERRAGNFVVIPSVLDFDAARAAGVGPGRSKVAVAADGVALVVWGEGGDVFARRVFEQRISLLPQALGVPNLEGHGGGPADVPDVDVQDDSSFAWVAFRQLFDDGAGGLKSRALARRLVGSAFDPPVTIDGLGFPIADSVGPPRVDISGRGDGYAGSATSTTAFGAVLKDRKFNPAVVLGLGATGSVLPVPAVDEAGDGLIAWEANDGAVHAQAFDNVAATRVPQAPQGEVALSGGGTDAPLGLEAAADRAGDVAVAFVQGTAGNRALAVASFDRAPGAFRLNSGTTFRNVASTPLRWSTAFELWDPLRYSVEIDGRVVGTSATNALAVPGLPDGVHRWRVLATDQGGQITATPLRVLRHDGTPPRATIRVSGTRRRGRPVRVRVKATDANRAGRPASGVGRVLIAFGDGANASGRSAAHSYRRRGSSTVRVSVRDRAGNTAVVRRRITIR